MFTVEEIRKKVSETVEKAVNGNVVDPRVINNLMYELQMDCKYKAQYFYNDPMGSTFSNESEYVLIAFSDNKEDLVKYCEEQGFKPSTKLFDGGYEVVENDPHGFYKRMRDNDMKLEQEGINK